MGAQRPYRPRFTPEETSELFRRRDVNGEAFDKIAMDMPRRNAMGLSQKYQRMWRLGEIKSLRQRLRTGSIPLLPPQNTLQQLPQLDQAPERSSLSDKTTSNPANELNALTTIPPTQACNTSPCAVCNSSTLDHANTLVCCHQCRRMYHQTCHQPNIPRDASTISYTSFRCTFCAQGTMPVQQLEDPSPPTREPLALSVNDAPTTPTLGLGCEQNPGSKLHRAFKSENHLAEVEGLKQANKGLLNVIERLRQEHENCDETAKKLAQETARAHRDLKDQNEKLQEQQAWTRDQLKEVLLKNGALEKLVEKQRVDLERLEGQNKTLIDALETERDKCRQWQLAFHAFLEHSKGSAGDNHSEDGFF